MLRKILNHILGKIRILFYPSRYKVYVDNISPRLNFYRINDNIKIVFSIKYFSKIKPLASFYPILVIRESYPSKGISRKVMFNSDIELTKNGKESQMICDIKPNEKKEFIFSVNINENFRPGLYEYKCQIWNPFKARGEYFWKYYPYCFCETKWLKLIDVIHPQYNDKSPPKVFISYDWSDTSFVDDLSSELCRYDIYVYRDKKNFWKIGNDINEKVKKYINGADYYLIVSSKDYLHKANNFKEINSGVGYETAIFSEMIKNDKYKDKFLPIYLEYENEDKGENKFEDKIPFYFKNRIIYGRFQIQSWKAHALNDLVSKIREMYELTKSINQR